MGVFYHVQAGKLFRTANDPDRAVECFWAALASDPKNINALVGLSDVVFDIVGLSGDWISDQVYWNDAEIIMRELLMLPGGHGVAQNYYALGRSLLAQRKLTEANQAFRRSLMLQPNLKSAQIALDASQKLGQEIDVPDYGVLTAAIIGTFVAVWCQCSFILVLVGNRNIYYRFWIILDDVLTTCSHTTFTTLFWLRVVKAA